MQASAVKHKYGGHLNMATPVHGEGFTQNIGISDTDSPDKTISFEGRGMTMCGSGTVPTGFLKQTNKNKNS